MILCWDLFSSNINESNHISTLSLAQSLIAVWSPLAVQHIHSLQSGPHSHHSTLTVQWGAMPIHCDIPYNVDATFIQSYASGFSSLTYTGDRNTYMVVPHLHYVWKANIHNPVHHSDVLVVCSLKCVLSHSFYTINNI